MGPLLELLCPYLRSNSEIMDRYNRRIQLRSAILVIMRPLAKYHQKGHLKLFEIYP